MRIFVASYAIPKPDRSAGDRRFFEIVGLLARAHRVDLWTCQAEPAISGEDQQRYRSALDSAGVRVFPHPASIERILAESYYDVGFFEFFWVAETAMPTFRLAQPHAAVVIDSVDIAFAREELMSKVCAQSVVKPEETKRRELAMYRAADAVIAVSEEDRSLLLAEEQSLRVGVVPIILRIRTDRKDPGSKELVFVGAFHWPPNVDGIIWFVEEIWPLIVNHVPDAIMNIVGSYPTEEIKAMAVKGGVRVHGFVPDTKPYLDRADISVAPLRYGGGMKGKVLEAMAAGLPVVTTSVGFQGLNAQNGEHLLVADEKEMFAQCVINLLRDQEARIRIGQAAREYTATLCAPEIADKDLNRLLVEISSHKYKARLPVAWMRYRAVVKAKGYVRAIVPKPLLRQIRKLISLKSNMKKLLRQIIVENLSNH